jgi:alanine dehydrogenase
MMLLDDKDVDTLATVPLALDAARRTAEIVARGALTTGRVQVGDRGIWGRVLLGSLPDLDLYGYKEFHRVGRRVRYHVNLFRASTGDAIAIVDGRRITSLRTAATAAVAAAHFFASPVRLGVIGSGEEAREGLRMLAGAVRVCEAAVFSPTAANREAFAAEIGAELGLPVRAVGSVGDALAGADAAYVATSSGVPFLAAGDVGHVPFLAAVGSTHHDQRELVGDVLARAGLVVVDCADARTTSGDMLDAVSHGFDPGSAVLLGDYLRGGDARPVVFKSIGSVEQDLVLAHHLVTAAAERGRGRLVDPVGSLRVMR